MVESEPDYDYQNWVTRNKPLPWYGTKRFLIILIIIILMWVWLMVFFYLKADEVTKDPCSICSEKMGTHVVCSVGDLIPTYRTYYPNGSIKQTNPRVEQNYAPEISNINFSKLE